MSDMFCLKGKVAIVTGGSGSLGEAVAEGFAEAGATVVVTARRKDALEAAVKKIEAKGAKALAIPCDVVKEEDCVKLVDAVMKEFGRIDILYCAAGIARRHPAENFPADDFKLVMEANVIGTAFACKAVAQVMIKQKYGKIITVSSVRANNGHPLGYAAYAASKGAINALTRQYSSEWAKYNICVNAVAPTIAKTPLTEEVFADPAKSKIFLDRIPMGRPMVPEDLVGTSIYLAAPASDYITGQVIYVDGGNVAG